MDIKSLKDKILQLAIQGKLVPQNENDESASVLLEKIKLEKEQLIKDKLIKKEKSLPEISEDEKLFKLPRGWDLCRLENVITLVSGRDLNSNVCNSEGLGIPYIMGASNMGKNGLDIERWIENPTVIGLKNDVMISVKGTVGKLNIINLEKVHLSRQVMSIRCYSELILNKYILLYLESYIEIIKEKSSGVIPGISRDNLLQIVIALPPIEEQKRIVAKVDELFKLIYELDRNKQDLLEDIANSRNKVLQLAIQGKLVEQCEDDEPASVLVEKIKEEKENLIKDKVIKKEKPLPEISEDENIFDLPKGWKWSRLGEISDYIKAGGDKPKDFSATKSVEYSIPVIANGKTNTGIVGYTKTATENNVCLTVSGRGTIGYSCIRNEPFCPIVRLIVICPNLNIDINYLNCALHYFIEQGVGTSIQQLTVPMIKPKVIPLPPLEEQKRIANKVDLIMDYLDKLQQEIESQEIILEDILQ